MTLSINCCFCGKLHTVKVKESDFIRYENGMLAQKAFPYLNATQREQIISGMCPKCQESVFGSDDEDEGDDIDACMRESLESTGQWW